ncbi:MAG: IclR family transcriptional regulator [Desulfuromonadaceae bacterium]
MIVKTKPDYSIQTVGFALDVLEQFYGSDEELGLTELCRRLKLQKNRVFRLLATLESRNYIEQNKVTTNYRLGLKNLRLGQAFVKQTGLRQLARPVLETLARKCEETSCVAIMKDFHVVYIDAIESKLPIRVVASAGTMHPFYCTAAGKILASALNENKLLEYCSNGELRRFTSHTICDPIELVHHLRGIVKLGYAVGDEELEAGAKCVAAPIRDYTKNVIGAVSISGPSMRFTAEHINNELLPLVKDAANELSFCLGY